MFSSRISLLMIVFLLIAVTGCADTAMRTRSSNAESVDRNDDRAIEALYSQLDAASKRYASGLELERGNEPELGKAEMKAALDELQAAAVACAAKSGCETQRFFSSFDRLLRIDSEVLSGRPQVESAIAESTDSIEPAGETASLANALPEAGRTETLLNGRQLSELVALNAPIKAGIEEWLTQLRPNLMVAYENYQYLRYRMWPEYQKAGLPEAILFGILAKESGGKVHAVSRSGASGPCNLCMPRGCVLV